MRALFRRSIGLDLGSHAVKAVTVRQRPWGPRLARTGQVPVVDGDPAAAVRLLVKPGRSGERVNLGLSGTGAFFRWLDLPRMSGLSAAKRRQAAAFALESHLPVGLEELTVDVARWQTSARGGSRGLVFGLARSKIERTLAELEGSGPKPQAVSLDTIGLLAAAEAAGVVNGVVIDLGQTKSTVLCLVRGELAGLGFVETAGESFDRHLAGERECSLDQARAAKEAMADPQETVDVFGPVLESLSQGAARIIRAASLEAGPQPQALYLSGGLSRLPGLGRFLGKSLSLEAAALNPLRRPLAPEMIPALGLALDGRQFNLGRDLVRPVALARQIKLAAGALALVLVLGGANLWQELEQRRQALARLTAAEAALFKENLPQVTKVVSPVRQMQTELDKARDELAALKKSAGQPVLEILLSLDKLAQGKAIQLGEIVIDGPKIILAGRAQGFEVLTAFQAALSDQGEFKDVARESSRIEGLDKGVRFRLRMKR
ncbi:MAG: hypothetical protein JRJ59_03250 [Deltaproteobacteria bacterium]|nr:hypothetical protein [Deltaproteobacteria bacterium]